MKDKVFGKIKNTVRFISKTDFAVDFTFNGLIFACACVKIYY